MTSYRPSKSFIVLLLAVVIGGWWFIFEYPYRDAKEAVRQRLKDPESAQFRGLYKLDSGEVFGEVNAKNEMGGYIGFRKFSVQKYKGVVIE